jgi:cytidyltransferase-like protein
MKSAKVIVFGTFDPFHEGHLDFLRQAKELGTTLTVVVARDTTIRATKQREPFQSEAKRCQHIANVPLVDQVLLGDEQPARYQLLQDQQFDIIALGYDQQPNETEIQTRLKEFGKEHVTVVRLKPYKPEQYKSSYFRSSPGGKP